MNKVLSDFIRDSLQHGQSREEVYHALIQAGWSPVQVREALSAWVDISFPIPVPAPRASSGAREAFLYLLLFLSLYIFSISLGSLLFGFIELAFGADGVWRSYSSIASSERDVVLAGMRASSAWIITSFPVFLIVSSYLARAALIDSSVLISPVRRWLTYTTIFIASTVALVDIALVVTSILNGDLPMRFILKAAVVSVISGTIIYWYLSDMRRFENKDAL